MLDGLTKVTKLSQTRGLAGQGHFSFPLSYQARGSVRPGPGPQLIRLWRDGSLVGH